DALIVVADADPDGPACELGSDINQSEFLGSFVLFQPGELAERQKVGHWCEASGRLHARLGGGEMKSEKTAARHAARRHLVRVGVALFDELIQDAGSPARKRGNERVPLLDAVAPAGYLRRFVRFDIVAVTGRIEGDVQEAMLGEMTADLC